MSALAPAAIGGQLLSGVTTSLLAPVINIATAGVNHIAPTLIPPPGALIDALWKQQLSRRRTSLMLSFAGVHWPEEPDGTAVATAWDKIIQSARPRIPPAQYAELIRRGLVDPGYWVEICNWAGMSEDWEQKSIYDSTLTISAEDAFVQGELGIIPQDVAAALIKIDGWAEQGRYSFYTRKKRVESPNTMWKWFRQGLVTSERAASHTYASRVDNHGPWNATSWSDLILPTTGQLLQLSRLGLGAPGWAFAQTLLQELPTGWDSWHKSLSAGDTLDKVIPNALGSNEWTHEQLEWAAHWRTLDPRTVARWRDMVRARAAGWTPPSPLPDLPVDDTYVAEASRQAGLLPNFRGFETAETYQQIGQRQLIQVGEFAGMTTDQIKSRFILEGYTDADAGIMSKALAARIRLFNNPWFKSIPYGAKDTMMKAICEALKLGLQSPENTSASLQLNGFSSDEAAATIEWTQLLAANETALTSATELKRLAWAAPAAGGKALLEAYQYGAITTSQLSAGLSVFGLSSVEIQNLVAAQQQQQLAAAAKSAYEEQQREAKEAQRMAKAAVIDSLKQGLIDGAAANQLLISLGDNPALSSATVALALSGVHARHVGAVVAAIRRAVMEGVLSQPAALSQLLRTGVTPAAAQELMNTWNGELGPSHHGEAIGKVLSQVGKGLAPVTLAQQRLTNLGWNGVDAQLALAEAEGNLVKGKAAAAKAAASARSAAAKQLLAVAKQQKSAAAQAIKDAQKYVSKSTLKQWFQQGIVDTDYVREYFGIIGTPAPVVAATLDSWQHPVKKVPQGTPSGLTVGESIPGA